MGFVIFGLICDACSWRCSFTGSMCVSSCRFCVSLSVVHHVAILSVVSLICSLCVMLVVTIWWKPTRVWVLLWLCILRVWFPFVFLRVVDVSALRAFVVVFSLCLLYVSSLSGELVQWRAEGEEWGVVPGHPI